MEWAENLLSNFWVNFRCKCCQQGPPAEVKAQQKVGRLPFLDGGREPQPLLGLPAVPPKCRQGGQIAQHSMAACANG